ARSTETSLDRRTPRVEPAPGPSGRPRPTPRSSPAGASRAFEESPVRCDTGSLLGRAGTPPGGETTPCPGSSASFSPPTIPQADTPPPGDSQSPCSPCLGWPDRSRDVSPCFLDPPDRIGPKIVVTI